MTFAVVAGVQAIHDVGRGDSAGSAIAVGIALCLAAGLLFLCQWRAGRLHPMSQADAESASHSSKIGTAELWLLFALGLIALVPRLIALRHSLWYDELWTIDFMLGGPIYAVTHQAGYNSHLLNSLLGSLLLRFQKALHGGAPLNGSGWLDLVRLPALVFGTASVPALYLAARPYVERPVALVAALLLALSPAAVDLSAQTRGYSGVIFFTILQASAFGKALRTRAPGDWIAWLIWATLGTFAHLYLVFPVIVDGLFALILAVYRGFRARDGKGALGLLEQPALMMVVWALLSAVCYSGVIGVVREQLRLEAGTPPMARAHEVLLPFIQGWGGAPQHGIKPIFYAFCAAFAVAGAIYLYRYAPKPGFYLALLLIVPPILVEIAKPHFVYMRFFSFALPALALWLASGLWEIALSARKRMGQINLIAITGALTAAYLLLTLPGLRQVLMLPKQDFKHAAILLAQAQREGVAVAAVGAGHEFLKVYGVSAFYPGSVDQLLKFVRQHGTILIADTDLTVNIRMRSPAVTRFLRRYGGSPLAVFPGRYATWPSRWLDGDSDFKIYRLSEDRLPQSFQTSLLSIHANGHSGSEKQRMQGWERT